jgi:hypothetical protein
MAFGRNPAGVRAGKLDGGESQWTMCFTHRRDDKRNL